MPPKLHTATKTPDDARRTFQQVEQHLISHDTRLTDLEGRRRAKDILLDDLADVRLTDIVDGQVVSYVAAEKEYQPLTLTLDGLTDTTLAASPADNELFAYDATTGKWINQTLGEAGVAAALHASLHTDGTDDIQDATAAQKGVMTAAYASKLDGIEALAEVTSTAKVDAAGAVMETDYTANSLRGAVTAETPVNFTVDLTHPFVGAAPGTGVIEALTVSDAQVAIGRALAQWNANKVNSATVDNTGATDGDVLIISGLPGAPVLSYGGLGSINGTVDASVVTYTPSVPADWDGDVDPGDLDDALNQLAERIDDTEIGVTNLAGPQYVALAASAYLTSERILTAGEGIDLTDGGAGAAITISCEKATDANLGVATFNTANFLVTSGDVTIKNGGVAYAEIQSVSANTVLGSIAGGAPEEISCTAAGQALLDDADAAAQRTTLGLDTMATQAASAVAITGGTGSGLTTFTVGDADDTSTPSKYLGVGTDVDGMFYSVSDVVYLEGRTLNTADVHLRINDGGTRKTLVHLDADVALLKLGYNTESDVVIGVDAQSSVTEVRPSVTEKVDLGNDTGPYRFNEVHFVTLKPKSAPTYTVTDPSTDRDLDVDSDTTAQVAAVLGTLISDLQTLGVLS
jgi:hypothetical protein